MGLRYRPEIAGLRAVAVISVVLFHARFIRGGFIGVDVFFVASGYLITSLIVVQRLHRRGRLCLSGSRSPESRGSLLVARSLLPHLEAPAELR
jgi:hypothetical protein